MGMGPHLRRAGLVIAVLGIRLLWVDLIHPSVDETCCSIQHELCDNGIIDFVPTLVNTIFRQSTSDSNRRVHFRLRNDPFSSENFCIHDIGLRKICKRKHCEECTTALEISTLSNMRIRCDNAREFAHLSHVVSVKCQFRVRRSRT